MELGQPNSAATGVGQVPSRGRERGNHTLMFLSLFPTLTLCLKINDILKKKKREPLSPESVGDSDGPEVF